MEEEECECAEGAPAWMATFSDLATLLLTFFVLLLSFAEMDITEFKTMLGSIRDAFGVKTIHDGPHHAASTTLIELLATPSSLAVIHDEERTLLRAIRRYIQKEGLAEDVEVLSGERGVIVRMKDSVLFDTGSATVKLEGLPILEKIAQLALAFPEGLSVEGHTDDRPIHTAQFPSNWELSTARATQTLRALQRNGELPVQRLQVVGYAETKPLRPNDSDDNRARNRRVEFVFRRAVQSRTSMRENRSEQSPPDSETGEETQEEESPETAAVNALVNGDSADNEAEPEADTNPEEAEPEADTNPEEAEPEADTDAEPDTDAEAESEETEPSEEEPTTTS